MPFSGIRNYILLYRIIYKHLYKRYKNLFYGLRNLNKKPDLIFIFNAEDNLNVIKEAHKADIPVMCILDTNISIKNITVINCKKTILIIII